MTANSATFVTIVLQTQTTNFEVTRNIIFCKYKQNVIEFYSNSVSSRDFAIWEGDQTVPIVQCVPDGNTNSISVTESVYWT